ncbi:hypothetical protein KKD70_01950 [Patescibacteria group bacterium]|nr:hypothetical protein [Patescibacteria group bacterium]
MEIIPVIYILKGQVVALYKGSLEQKEVYRTSPVDLAKNMQSQGAHKILIVDLDASEFGDNRNQALIEDIRRAVSCELMIAGRIRTMEALDYNFKIGMNFVVLGVAARQIYAEAIKKYGADRVIVGIKAKGDEVLTDEKRAFPLRVIDFAEGLPELGVTQVLFKDIFKEGTQVNPNYDEIDRIMQMTPLEVYVSGGIGDDKNLRLLKKIGTKGAMIGKAIYERELIFSDFNY